MQTKQSIETLKNKNSKPIENFDIETTLSNYKGYTVFSENVESYWYFILERLLKEVEYMPDYGVNDNEIESRLLRRLF